MRSLASATPVRHRSGSPTAGHRPGRRHAVEPPRSPPAAHPGAAHLLAQPTPELAPRPTASRPSRRRGASSAASFRRGRRAAQRRQPVRRPPSAQPASARASGDRERRRRSRPRATTRCSAGSAIPARGAASRRWPFRDDVAATRRSSREPQGRAAGSDELAADRSDDLGAFSSPVVRQRLLRHRFDGRDATARAHPRAARPRKPGSPWPRPRTASRGAPCASVAASRPPYADRSVRRVTPAAMARAAPRSPSRAEARPLEVSAGRSPADLGRVFEPDAAAQPATAPPSSSRLRNADGGTRRP